MRLLLSLAMLVLLAPLARGEEPLPPFPQETADGFPGITALPPVADRPPLRVAALGDPQDLTEPLLPDGVAPPGQPRQLGGGEDQLLQRAGLRARRELAS